MPVKQVNPYKMGKVTISRSNMKIGRTMNISLPPIVTCRKNVPCAELCYAMKAYRMYPGVRASWDGNLAAYKQHASGYFWQIHQEIKRAKSVKVFRWHVGGDIPDMEYLLGMITLAAANPAVEFLCFTKRYELLAGYVADGSRFPKNLKIVVSMWPGLKVPDGLERFPKAWMRDTKCLDKRIPAGARKCPGKCTACGLCWKLPAGKSVVFQLH